MNRFLARISREDMDLEEEKNFSSREEYLKYKWKQQEDVVKKQFGIENFDICYYDSGSAYKIEKFGKRGSFHELLKDLFKYHETTVKDLFWGKIKRFENERLFVYDYNRVSRIMEYNLLFSLLSDMFGVQIFSCNQKHIVMGEDEDVFQKGTRYIMLNLVAMNSEQYSADTSKNTKKATVRKDNITFSHKNNVWGRGFHDVNGKKLSNRRTISLKKDIRKLITEYEKNMMVNYYEDVISIIRKKYRVKLGKASLTKMKQELEGEKKCKRHIKLK